MTLLQGWYLRASIIIVMLCVFLTLEWKIGTEVGMQCLNMQTKDTMSVRDVQFLCIYVKSSTAAAAAKSLQSCLTLCDPIDGSPPGSSVPGTLQARTLEWVAISFSNALK